jgi:hypothetical protein
MAVKVPTPDDYRTFDGAHCSAIWNALGEDWRCPGCARSKFEILRWTRRFPNQLTHPGAKPYMGWLAAFHAHHDHGTDAWRPGYLPGPARFPETMMCDHCNAADGRAKKQLGLPEAWSFSPVEIARIVTATPHAGHTLDLGVAAAIYAAANGVGPR